MMNILSILPAIFATACLLPAAQTISLAQSALTVRPGQQFTLRMQLVDTTPLSAGFSWILAMPTGFTYIAAPGAAAVAAGKTVNTNPAVGSAILFGLNQNVIQPGDVCVYTITVPATQAFGPVSFALTAVVAGSASGSGLAISAGPPVTITVAPSRFDLNSDGAIDAQDLLLVANQATGVAPCTTADFNADGKCDLIDGLLLALGSLGLIQ